MRYAFVLAAAALALALAFTGPGSWNSATASDLSRAPMAPEFTHTDASEWINSEPLTMEGLRGKVVLLDIWTFDCWNCYRSFPWLKALEKRYEAQGLQVIGIHTPEFEHEKVRTNIEAKVAEFGLPHPVMIDNDFSYWKALGNRYWPTYYLIDKQGRLRARFIGETHADTPRARSVDAAIAKLLAE